MNDKLYARFKRLRDTMDVGSDLPLTDDKAYFVLFARGKANMVNGAMTLAKHQEKFVAANQLSIGSCNGKSLHQIIVRLHQIIVRRLLYSVCGMLLYQMNSQK